jgi:hypothetical protein
MRPLPLASPAAEVERNGGSKDPRAEEAAAFERAELAVPRGLSSEAYARLAAVNAYRAAEASAASYAMAGEVFARLDAFRRMLETHLLDHARADVPPPRPRSDSVSSLDPAEITHNGTERFTREQVEQLAAAKFAEMKRLETLEDNAAPMLFFRGSIVPHVVKGVALSLALLLGAVLWSMISPHLR